jgi:hypothetical protein
MATSDSLFLPSQCTKTEIKITKMEREKYYNLVPSVGGSFSFGWRKMFEKAFLPLLLAVIIVGLLNGPSGATFKMDSASWFNLVWALPAAIFGMAYSFLFLPVIKYGEKYLFLKAMRDEETELRYLFEGFKTKYLKIILANLIVVALNGYWFCTADCSWNYCIMPVGFCSLTGYGQRPGTHAGSGKKLADDPWSRLESFCNGHFIFFYPDCRHHCLFCRYHHLIYMGSLGICCIVSGNSE